LNQGDDIMRLPLFITILCLLTGAIGMAAYSARQEDGKYDNYVSKDQELSLAMDYPLGWFFGESRGSSGKYAEVSFYGPKGKDKKPVAYIAVTVIAFARAEFEPKTAQGLAEDLIQKRLLLPQAKLLSKSVVKLLDTEAISISLSYQSLDNLYKVNPNFIPTEEKILVFYKNDKFYIMKYSNIAEDFKNLEPAFDHCVQSLRLK